MPSELARLNTWLRLPTESPTTRTAPPPAPNACKGCSPRCSSAGDMCFRWYMTRSTVCAATSKHLPSGEGRPGIGTSAGGLN